MSPAITPVSSDQISAIETGTAVVFPGQGSQRPQMALPWQADPAARLWDEADEIVGWGVSALGTTAGEEQLRDPVNCQVALYVHHAVLFTAWRRAGGQMTAAAGHSLGEYNALLAAGVLSFEDGLRLVEARARATQAAAAANPGGMVACLGGDSTQLRAICAGVGAHIANDNAEGQLVVSGSDAALAELSAATQGQRVKVVRLAVGAAYHSPLMEPAEEALAAALHSTTFREARVPVVANVDAAPHRRPQDWPGLLTAQLTAPVRWRETMLTLAGAGVSDIVELCASPVLNGLAKRVTPQLGRGSVTVPSDLESL